MPYYNRDPKGTIILTSTHALGFEFGSGFIEYTACGLGVKILRGLGFRYTFTFLGLLYSHSNKKCTLCRGQGTQQLGDR